jgi:basic amino acid/polyamine antiporter, APA family
VTEHLAYARRASGLVRGLGLFDTFAVAFMNQGLVASISLTLTLGLGVFLGGNLIIAAIISTVLAGIGFTLVWGILGGSMPRSGGPYVYNSRILHPLVGIAQSFGDALIWLWWIGTLAPLAVDPGLVTTFEFLGWNDAAAWLQQDYALFIVASAINLTGFLHVVVGIVPFARAQRAFLFVGTLGAVVMGIVFTVTSRATFTARWDALAAQYDSLDYAAFIDKVDTAVKASGVPNGVPATWNWPDTLGVMFAMSWLFAYGYSAAFVGGEVRRPERNMILGQLLAVLVPFVFVVWIAWALYHSVGFEFLSAASWNDYQTGEGGGVEGYTLPWATSVFGLVAVATESRIWPALVGLAFVLFNVWWVALSYLAFPRTLFAWGMDRIGPRWFTDINPRFASPVKTAVVCFVFGEVLIGSFVFVSSNQLQNLTLTGMEITSVFAVTAIAALLFPYLKRSRAVWDISPYRRWRFLGVPVVVWGAIANLIYLAILLYALVVMKASTAFQWFTFGMFVVVWVLGIAWYWFWRDRSRLVGIDVRRTYDELPPE